MSPFDGQLRGAAAATRIDSDTSYTWFGTPAAGLPPAVAASMTPEAARAYLSYSLKTRLYADFYCRGAATPSEGPDLAPHRDGQTPFVAGLSLANGGRGCFEPGWRVRGTEGGKLIVERDGLALWAQPGDVTLDGAEPVGGTPARVRMPKELLKLSPGFYMALGDVCLAGDRSQGAMLRLYWHLAPEAAAGFIGLATRACNEAGLAFRLKVARQPAEYRRRCDSGVLYFLAADYPVVARIAVGVHARLGEGMLAGTPALARPLARGLALAEDPGGAESFGTSRCALVAEGLIVAREQGAGSDSERLAAIYRAFRSAGLDPEAPYLNAGSADYPWPPEAIAS